MGGLLERFRGLALVGAGLLGWIAGETMAEDPAIVAILASTLGPTAAREVELASALAAAAVVVTLRWRRPLAAAARAGRDVA
jgi:hypothetical protein